MSDITIATIHPQKNPAPTQIDGSVAWIRRSRCVRSPWIDDARDAVLLCTFPCEPMARASASVGFSYAGVLVCVALVYGGGIACFGASAWLIDTSIAKAVLVGYILNMAGALVSGLFVAFVIASISSYLEGDPTVKFGSSIPALILVVVYFASQVVLLGITAYLRHHLLKRSQASSLYTSSFGGFCCTLLFPCCSFAAAMQRARVVQKPETRHLKPNVLPAYNS